MIYHMINHMIHHIVVGIYHIICEKPLINRDGSSVFA